MFNLTSILYVKFFFHFFSSFKKSVDQEQRLRSHLIRQDSHFFKHDGIKPRCKCQGTMIRIHWPKGPSIHYFSGMPIMRSLSYLKYTFIKTMDLALRIQKINVVFLSLDQFYISPTTGGPL